MARLTSTVLAPGGMPVVHHRGEGDSADAIRHEAAMLALARGPGVVDLVAAGDEPGDGAWLCTRYLAGGTLTELTRAGGEVATVAALARVAATLAELHDRGIVHGRLSPDHVVGGAGEAALCGFSAAVAAVEGGRVDPGVDIAAFAALVEISLTADHGLGRRARRSAAGLAGPSPVTTLRAVANELAGIAGEAGPVRSLTLPMADAHGRGDTGRPPGARIGGSAEHGAAPVSRQPTGRRWGGDGADARGPEALDHGEGPVDSRWSGSAGDRSRLLAAHATGGPDRVGRRAGPPARLGLLGAGVAAAVALVALGALVSGTVWSDATGPVTAAPAQPPFPAPDQPEPDQPPPSPPTTEAPLPAQVWPDPGPAAPPATPGPEVAVVEHEGVRYRIGEPGDIVVVGDWDCDGAPTPSVVRPADGSVWTFRSWPSGSEVVVAEPIGYAAAPLAAMARPEREGCDVLAVTTADGRLVVVRPG